MFRLTREVRFAVNDGEADEQLRHPPTNSYGGYPSLVGYGRFYSLAVTLAGELDPATGYLRNIKEIDDAVRRHVIPAFRADVLGLKEPRARARALTPFEQPAAALRLLQSELPQTVVDRVRLCLSPFLSISSSASEHPMVRLARSSSFPPRTGCTASSSATRRTAGASASATTPTGTGITTRCR